MAPPHTGPSASGDPQLGLRIRRWAALRRKMAKSLDVIKSMDLENYRNNVCRRRVWPYHPIRNRCFAARQLGTHVVAIVELPPLKRHIEWPTVALAFIIYGAWLMATYFYRDLPWWGLAAIGAWIIAWQLNLQHETIHGHPTRNRRVNEMIGRWPLSLWLPYPIYRSTHLAHHRDENLTDPLDDPESYYWADGQWRALGPLGRALVAAQSTLLGRMIFGPAWTIPRFVRGVARDAWRGKTRVIVARHLLECAVILIWVIGVCGMPLWVYVAC